MSDSCILKRRSRAAYWKMIHADTPNFSPSQRGTAGNLPQKPYKYFRHRRDRPNYKKKIVEIDVVAVVMPSPSESEVAIPSVEDVPYMPPAGGTEVIISEIEDPHYMGTPDEERTVYRQVIDPNGCPVNLCAIKEIVTDAVNEAVSDVPPEVKEAAFTSSLIFASLAGLFFSVVLYRYIRHLYYPEPEGFFCGTFSWLFAPLFDAVCERHPQGGFFHDMRHESSILYDEVLDSFSSFFHLIMDGFHALGVIFSTMFEGFVVNIDEGVEELAGNVSENVSFLIRMRTKGSNHCRPPFNQNVGGGVDDGMKCCSEASGDTD
ncbi:hypothetical protein TELCIR_04220, partial [Teladorsagia circumcincta]